jgi:hypothetical protein
MWGVDVPSLAVTTPLFFLLPPFGALHFDVSNINLLPGTSHTFITKGEIVSGVNFPEVKLLKRNSMLRGIPDWDA